RSRQQSSRFRSSSASPRSARARLKTVGVARRRRSTPRATPTSPATLHRTFQVGARRRGRRDVDDSGRDGVRGGTEGSLDGLRSCCEPPSLGETAVLFLTIESKAGDRVRVLSANPAKNAGHGSPTECSAKSYGHGRRLRARRGAPFAA